VITEEKMISKSRAGLLLVILLLLPASFAWSQGQSLSSLLEEEEPFYLNYGLDPYVRETIKREQTSYYDLFGVHIVDGFYVYQLYDQQSHKTKTADAAFDSTVLYRNAERWESKFWDNFSNLIMTRDAVGATKTE